MISEYKQIAVVQMFYACLQISFGVQFCEFESGSKILVHDWAQRYEDPNQRTNSSSFSDGATGYTILKRWLETSWAMVEWYN